MGRRVLKFDGAFGPEGCGGGFAADYKKRGRGFAAGCVEGLYSLRSGGDSGSAAEGGGGALGAFIIHGAKGAKPCQQPADSRQPIADSRQPTAGSRPASHFFIFTYSSPISSITAFPPVRSVKKRICFSPFSGRQRNSSTTLSVKSRFLTIMSLSLI